MGIQWTATVVAAAVVAGGFTMAGHADAADGECDGLANLGVINNAPRALDDEAWSLPGGAVTIDVLTNDRDFDDDQLLIESLATPVSGTAEIGDEGTVEYRPGLNFIGEDSFVYTVTDGRCGTDTAQIRVLVSPEPPALDEAEPARPVITVPDYTG